MAKNWPSNNGLSKKQFKICFESKLNLKYFDYFGVSIRSPLVLNSENSKH